jgi:hypothetical protein
MARYLYRTCPHCGNYLGVVVPQTVDGRASGNIAASCALCDYELSWAVVKDGEESNAPAK